MKRVFVSSSFKHLDDFLSFRLKKELEQIGYAIINPSRNEYAHSAELKESLEFLINKCDLFISILRDNNPWQYYELGYAIASSKQVLIVADYDVEIPSSLANYQFVRTGLSNSEAIFDILRYLEKLSFEEIENSKPVATLEEFCALIEKDKQAIDKISGTEFEQLLQVFFSSKGYDVSLTSPSSDYGYDLLINDFGGFGKTIVEVKKYNPNSKVSVNTIHQVFGAMSINEADYAIIITTSDFTSSAKEFASAYTGRLELWDLQTLIDKVRS